MRYTEKYLEENYSQEDLEEINEVVGALLGGGFKLASKVGSKVAPKLKGLFRGTAGSGVRYALGGAAFAGGAAVTKAGFGAAKAAAKKTAELAADPDRGRPSAAGFGGREDPTSASGRRLAQKVMTYNPFDRESKDVDDSPKPEVKTEPSDLETGFKDRRKGLFSKRKRG